MLLGFKKGNDNEKERYRPVSMLSVFLKKFEKLSCEQNIICKINSQSILLDSAKTTAS